MSEQIDPERLAEKIGATTVRDAGKVTHYARLTERLTLCGLDVRRQWHIGSVLYFDGINHSTGIYPNFICEACYEKLKAMLGERA